MAISPTNTMQIHRGVYAEFTGDGSSTVLTIPLTSHYAGRTSQTGVATLITTPTAFTSQKRQGRLSISGRYACGSQFSRDQR